MVRVRHLAFCICVLTAGAVVAQSMLPDGGFESGELRWVGEGVALDKEIFHSGKASLRLDMGSDRQKAGMKPAEKIVLDQNSPEPIMGAVWLRAVGKKSLGKVRGGMSIRLEFVDGTALYWYGPFELSAEDMSGAWVYREGCYKPRCAVASAIIGIYLHDVDGSIWADDIYFGPPCKLPAPPISTMPVSVTGNHGRFAEWATFRVNRFTPAANVFHLEGKDRANIWIDCTYKVTQTAPVYLTSAWGSQYWTLYHLGERELCQIHTNERLDLSKKGTHRLRVTMNSWCPNANPLRKGAYVFVTDYQKSFLIYSSDKRAGSSYKDAKTGRTFSFWDSVKFSSLKKAIGPTGTTAPFSVANLKSYQLGAEVHHSPAESPQGRNPATVIVIAPFLRDADGDRVPLINLSLHVKPPGGTPVRAKEILDRDGLPTGRYRAVIGKKGHVEVQTDVTLMTPAGLKKEKLKTQCAIKPAAPEQTPKPGKVALSGWGGPGYSLSPSPSDGPQSMERVVADAAKGGVGILIVHGKSGHGCYFRSKIAPAAQQSKWDQLKAAVAAGKKHGVRIYADYILGIMHPGDAKLHPDWQMLNSSGKPTGWYCYMNPEVRRYHISLMKEMVTTYDVDGLALDFCRPGGGCFCDRCCKLFEKKYGKPLKGIGTYDADWIRWKKDAITDYMREIAAALRAARPDLKFGGYVWSRIAMDKDRAGQDFPKWLKEGTFDFAYVGDYHSSLPFFRAVCRVCKKTADANGISAEKIIPMLGVGYIHNSYRHHETNAAMLARQLEIVSEEGLSHAGLFTFSNARVHLDTLRKHSACLGKGTN